MTCLRLAGVPSTDSDTSVDFATQACNSSMSGAGQKVSLVVRESGGPCTFDNRVAPEQEQYRHRGLVNLYLTQVRIDQGVC